MAYSNIPPSYVGGDNSKIGATTGLGNPEAASLTFTPAGAVPGDLLVLVAYAATATPTPGWSLSGTWAAGWVVAGTSVGQVSYSYGSMTVWTKQLTEDNVAGLSDVVVNGPPYKSGVLLIYRDASALDGPVVFGAGTGETATCPPTTLTARQSRLVSVAAGIHGQPWTMPGTTREFARYINFTSVWSADQVPASTGETAEQTATATDDETFGWITATLAVRPLTIPDPPGTGGAGSGSGVHFSPGVFQPLPVLTMNNADVPTAPGNPLKPVVLDGFRIRWGRDRVTDQPEPATGTVSLWFPSQARAATWAAADGLPGQLLELAWEGTLPGDTEPTRERFFRGRINALTIRALDSRNPDGTVTRGAVAELTLSSVLNDLQNITPRAAWPEEAMSARLDRVKIHADAYVDVQLRDYWADAHVEPIEATSQKTILDHIYALYDSCGADRMTYLPDAGELQPVLRRNYNGLRTLAQLHADPAGVDGPGRAGKGAYIRTLDVWPAGLTSADANTPNYLDAAGLEYDPAGDGLTLGPDQRITRVELTHPDSTADDPYESRTVVELVAGINETTHGVRAATIDSQLVWPSWADQAAAELAALVRLEGQEYKLAPVVWTTRKTGGFETVEQVRLLLTGGERQDLLFLQRSILPRFGIRPIFGVMGGEIGYAEGGWETAMDLAPVRPANLPQHPVSWEDIGDGLAWHDGDHPDGFHESVTYEDLKYVGRGLGATSTPADDGWDYSMTSPLDYTPTLALPFLAVGAPVNETRAMTQQLAEELEVILLDGVTGPAGAPGADGADGADGAPGVGVPTGGTTGQVLAKTSNADYATGWTTPTGGGAGGTLHRLAGGTIYGPQGLQPSTNLAHGTGQLQAVPFAIDTPAPSGINALAVRVGTAAASGVVALGVYEDNGSSYPGARMVNAGTVSAATTGEKFLTVSWSPTAGLYWLACLVTGANTTMTSNTGTSPFPVPTGPTGTALTTASGHGVAVTGQSALPATFPTSGYTAIGASTRVFVKTA